MPLPWLEALALLLEPYDYQVRHVDGRRVVQIEIEDDHRPQPGGTGAGPTAAREPELEPR